jgi:hypothetical protein
MFVTWKNLLREVVITRCCLIKHSVSCVSDRSGNPEVRWCMRVGGVAADSAALSRLASGEGNAQNVVIITYEQFNGLVKMVSDHLEKNQRVRGYLSTRPKYLRGIIPNVGSFRRSHDVVNIHRCLYHSLHRYYLTCFARFRSEFENQITKL